MKPALRDRLRALRAGLDPAERQAAEAAIGPHLDALFDGHAPIAAYAAHGSELDVVPWAERAIRRGRVIAWPRVTIDGLVFAACHPRELVPGYRGIREPPADAELIAARYLDAILVPGVAFDAAGHRLGQGGGFYDRLLASLRTMSPAPRAVGVAFALQLVDVVPKDAWDQPVDVLVSERGPMLIAAAP